MLRAAKRHWFQFSLRTLLVVVTVAGVPMGWLGWNLNRVRQRHAVLARYPQPTNWSGRPYAFCVVAPSSKAPGVIFRLVGEPAFSQIHLQLTSDRRSQSDEIERVADLFPEAKILVYIADPKGRVSKAAYY